MKWVKRMGIWLAGVLAILLLMSVVGAFAVRTIGVNVLMPSMCGYSKKMIFPEEVPTAPDEQKKLHAMLGVRSILGDIRLEPSKEDVNLLKKFLYGDLYVDESIIFTDPEGTYPLSSGIFAAVCDENIEGLSLIQTIGLIDVRAFAQAEGTDELTEVLKAHPEAAIRLNAYTVDQYLIEPVRITVESVDGSTEYLQCKFPSQGDIIETDTCYIKSEEMDYLGDKLALAKKGERASDRTAAKLLETFPFGEKNIEEQKNHYGIGSITATRIETSEDGYGMITVLRFNYLRTILLHSAVLGGIFTVILFLIFLARDRRSA